MEYQVIYRLDQEEYYCTDTSIFWTDDRSILEFIDNHRLELEHISCNNTILEIREVL